MRGAHRLDRLEADTPTVRSSPVLLYDAAAPPTPEAIQAFRRRQGMGPEAVHVLIPRNGRDDADA